MGGQGAAQRLVTNTATVAESSMPDVIFFTMLPSIRSLSNLPGRGPSRLSAVWTAATANQVRRLASATKRTT